MPIYDYHCETCGLDFEVEQAFSEDTLKKCPTKKSGRSPEGCVRSGRGVVVKVFSAPGITFKGGGFYKTDSRSGSKSSSSSTADSSSSSSSSSDASAAKTETKSDSKAGSKSESKAVTSAASSD